MKKIKIGLDVSPLHDNNKIRGVGFYTQRLITSIRKYADNVEIIKLENRKDFNRSDFDILHIPYFSPYFLTLPVLKKKKLIVTIHDLITVKYPKHYPPGIKAKTIWHFQKFLAKNIDLIVTDSEASKRDVVKLLKVKREKVKVVYLAAGEEFKKMKIDNWKLKIKQKYSLPDIFALYVGDVNWNKNIPGLVMACQKINMPLVIAGKQAVSQNYDRSHPENQDLVWLQSMINKHKSKIYALGFVETQDLVKIYNLATVYCQPSFDEGFGLPVLEAMSCGCPVVCTKRGSLAEIAGKAAVLVEPQADHIAKGIRLAIKNKSSLVMRATKQAKKFSWFKTAKEMAYLFRRCFENN